jgi:hypothetical protein
MGHGTSRSGSSWRSVLPPFVASTYRYHCTRSCACRSGPHIIAVLPLLAFLFLFGPVTRGSGREKFKIGSPRKWKELNKRNGMYHR